MTQFNDQVVCKADVVAPGATLEAENLNPSNAAGVGVQGTSVATGVRGRGEKWCGVIGDSHSDIGGVGVWGEHHKGGTGVYGRSLTTPSGRGVWGHSETDVGVYGQSNLGNGVRGDSNTWIGVYGATSSTRGGAGVMGEHRTGGTGVRALSKDGWGLQAESATNEAIHASTKAPLAPAIAAFNDNPEGTGAAIFARKAGTAGFAGVFEGRVRVTGEIEMVNGDCAEEFDIDGAAPVEPGTVMALGDDGSLHACARAHDTGVVGVVSGAGTYQPALVLDRQHTGRVRQPIALIGKVYCKVDADLAPIAIGDLLTASATPGHAMKVVDATAAVGTVIGKALRPLARGCGLIPILVALR